MPSIAFVMDPLESLSLKKDSTIAMMRAAQRRGWPVTAFMQRDLLYAGHEVIGVGRSVELTEPFATTLAPADAQGGWYRAGEARREALAGFDIVMMRKDPPFDIDYVYTTYLLERVEEAGAFVVNRPRSLRDCNEKFFATRFPQCSPPLIVSAREDELRAFQHEQGNVVFKRLDGMGGMAVFRVMEGDPNLGVILEMLTRSGHGLIMGQKFLPEIAAGDKRILIVDGVPVDYALARIPKFGEARGNLAAGGKGVGQPLSERDRWIANEVGPELVRRGLTFVGIDVIGDYLTEVNVTCPTCIRELDAQFGLDIGGMLLDAIATRL